MLTPCRTESHRPQSQEELRGGSLWLLLLTAYFNAYSMREGMAGRNTWAEKAFSAKQNCKEGLGGPILLFFSLVLLSVHLFPLKQAKLK